MISGDCYVIYRAAQEYNILSRFQIINAKTCDLFNKGCPEGEHTYCMTIMDMDMCLYGILVTGTVPAYLLFITFVRNKLYLYIGIKIHVVLNNSVRDYFIVIH